MLFIQVCIDTAARQILFDMLVWYFKSMCFVSAKEIIEWHTGHRLVE